MSTQIQRRRGTTAEHSTFTGVEGELTVDTTKDTVVVHDGATTGGRPLLREDQANLPSSVTNGLYTPGTNQVALSTNGTGRLFVDASGNVGVGNNSPSGLLHISGPDTTVRIQTTVGTLADMGNSTSQRIAFQGGNAEIGLFKDSGGNFSYVLGTNGSADIPLVFRTGTRSERLRITSAGLVGVGTSSPGHILDVFGSSPTIALLGNSGNVGREHTLLFSFQNSVGSRKSGASIAAVTTNGTAGTESQDIEIKTINSGTFANRVIIKSDGKVGIGTTSPQRDLQLGDNTTAFKVISLQTTTSGTSSIYFGDNTATSAEYAGMLRYSHSDDAMQFWTSSTERARIDSSGKLLVGTSSARTGFGSVQIEGTAYNSISCVNNTNDPGSSSLVFGKSRGTAVGSNTIVQSGDVLGSVIFQGADGTDMATRAAAIFGVVDGTPGADDMPGRLVFSTTADGASSPTERMRITNSGSVLLGCTSAPNPGSGSTTSGFAVNGTGNDAYLSAKIDNNPVGYFRRDGTDGTLFDFRKANTTVGTIAVTASATAYNTSSDYRLKENVTPVTDGITRLQQLKPSRFNFIAEPGKTVDGFLAHEVQAIVPEAITGEKDAVDDEGNPVYQGIDQSKLVPLLTAALQEAIGRIETLEAEVAALKG